MDSKSDAALGLPLVAEDGFGLAEAAIEQQVLALFDSTAPALLRYVASFGLKADDTEDVVQDVFLSLFYHLRWGRPRTNLRGWLFKVAHNLALRQRRRRLGERAGDDVRVDDRVDPAPDPEVRMALTERARRVRSVFRALPERDRQCLFLRAEGLRYRDIARTLGISLGSVAKSLARAMTRFVNAERG